MSRKFLKFIAYLQVIGIILVVLGHSFHEYPDGSQGKTMLFYRMLYSFRMPLFMFVSGFLMVYTPKLRGNAPKVSKFVMTKIKRLLLPFAVLTLVTFIPRAMMSGMADDNLSLSLDSLLAAFIYQDRLVIPYFWFLQASFILLIFSYITITLGDMAKINHIVLYCGMIVLFLILPILPVSFTGVFSLNETARLGIYFACGVAYGRFAPAIDRVVPWTSFTFFFAAIALWAVAFHFTENTPYITICSLLGIAMSVSLAKLLEKYDIRFIDHLIGANYMIFLLSWYFNVITQQVLHHFVELPWWCYSVMSLICGIYIPWLCYRYLNSHPESRWVKATAFLLGQSLKPSKNSPAPAVRK